MNNLFLETIKAEDGKLFHLEYHQKRYEEVLSSLDVREFPNLEAFLHPPQKGLYRCRVLYGATSIDVSYHLYHKRKIRKLKLVFDDTIEYSKKYANRSQLDDNFAQKEEADDILIVKNDLVTDTSVANLAFFDGEKWWTPQTPLLKGTTRARLLEKKQIYEKAISVHELQEYEKVALLNAMIDFDIIAEDKQKGLYC